MLYLLYQHNNNNNNNKATISPNMIMEKNMIVTRDPKTFDFDWPKDFDESLKHEIEFIIKSNQSIFS